MKKKYFFGWTNIKWFIKEFLAMYSNSKSYFSKKRFESSIAFIAAMLIICGHVYHDRYTITNSEILADAALLFAIAGYTVKEIQKEKNVLAKKTDPKKTDQEDYSKDEDAV